MLITPLFLIKSKDAEITLKYFWQGLSGYILALCLCMTLNVVLKGANISELTSSYTLTKIIGTKINFPWFLLIVIPIFLLISFGLYCLIRFIICKIAHTKFIEEPSKEKKNEFFDIYAFATKTVCCMQGILLLIIIATLVKKPQGNVWGLTCLIPFVMTIFCILTINEMEKLINNNDESVYNTNNKETKKILIFAFIGNFIFGFAFMAQLKNERENIAEYKKRMERKRQRELEENEAESNSETKSDDKVEVTFEVSDDKNKDNN